MAFNSDLFNLTNWNLTLPVNSSGGTSGTAYEIENLVGYENSKYFYDSGSAMVFKAAVDGATTSGSNYARSELREMKGETRAAWKLSEGGTLTATLEVDAVPKKSDGTPGRIIVGQIHGEDEELVRLYYENGKMYFMNDQAGSGNSETKFLLKNASGQEPSISLNEKFSYKIDAHGDTLKVDVYADGQTYSSTSKINSVWQSDTFYFKAGLYLGVNESNGSGAAQVSFHGLDFGHSSGSGLGGLTSGTSSGSTAATAGDIVGTAAADVLAGGDLADILSGEGGNDTLNGGKGNDRLYGDTGNDTLLGGTGNDTLWGGADNDLLKGEGGNDLLYGEGSHDILRGHDGNDRLYGGAGNDKLDGYDHNDTLWGDTGSDSLNGGNGNDTLDGGAGGDILQGGYGADLFRPGTDGVTDLIKDYSADAGDRLQSGATWKLSNGDTLVYNSSGTLLFRLEDYDAGDDGIRFA